MPVRLLLRDFVPRNGFYHIARSSFCGTATRPLHDHDFAEVFWVERGRGLHSVNGQRMTISPGDLVLIRPNDAHAFRAIDRAGLTIMNLAFAYEVLLQIRRKCFRGETLWPWHGDALPAMFRLPATYLARLSGDAEQLSMTHQRRLDLDWFLLTLLRLVQPTEPPHTDWPDWLASAARQIDGAEVLLDGAPALADIAGKSIEHVNRVVRRHLGKTTTQWINEHRLDHAARQLRMSQRSIVDIAATSGFSNLGHFYKRFANRFGMTPRRYRLGAQAPT